jgi:hypothetical protein
MEQEYSKETLAILGKMPSRFIRYGLFVCFLIIIGILTGLCLIHYQDTFKTPVTICKNEHFNDAIIENGNKYIAHMQVNPSDVWKIKTGSSAIISLNQYPKNIYGILSGYIIQVSQNSEKQIYDVYIQLPAGLTTSFDKELEYLLDMSGIAIVKGETNSVFKRIFSSVLSGN